MRYLWKKQETYLKKSNYTLSTVRIWSKMKNKRHLRRELMKTNIFKILNLKVQIVSLISRQIENV